MTFKKALLASTAVAILLGAAAPGFAAGTAANTPVTNSIDLDFQSGTTPMSLSGAASDNFVVDEKVNFTLLAQDGATVTVSPGESRATLTFLLTNTGNEARDFDIDVAQAGGGDPIGLTYDPTNAGDPGTWSFYTSPNATGGPDTGYNPTGTSGIGTIAADGQVYLKVVAHIAETATQGQEDHFDLTVRPVDGTGSALLAEDTSGFAAGTTEVVFGDISLDGTETATEIFFVNSAMITATKSVTVVSENRDGLFNCAVNADPAGAPFDAFIPGACLEYLIVLENDPGAGENAVNFSFTDTLPAGVTFRSTREDSGFDEIVVDSMAGTVTGTVYSMPPGGTATVVIRAEID